MDTNLIGYLLGNLDADTHREVEARLRSDPRLRAELARVRHRLSPLSALRSPREVSPPPGLARRTMARLTAHRRLPDAPPLSPAQRADARGLGPRRANLIVAALVLAILVGCVAPWLAACQRQARVQSGRNHLAQVWLALRSHADSDFRGDSIVTGDPPALLLAETSNDRYPLVVEPHDQEEAVAPYARWNVVCVGGQVHCYDQMTIERLIARPANLDPSADAAAYFAP